MTTLKSLLFARSLTSSHIMLNSRPRHSLEITFTTSSASKCKSSFWISWLSQETFFGWLSIHFLKVHCTVPWNELILEIYRDFEVHHFLNVRKTDVLTSQKPYNVNNYWQDSSVLANLFLTTPLFVCICRRQMNSNRRRWSCPCHELLWALHWFYV